LSAEIINLLRRLVKEAQKWGDMKKSIYDINSNDIVDNSEKLEGSSKAQVQDHNPKSHTHDQYLTTNTHDITTRHPVSVIKTATGSISGVLHSSLSIDINMQRKTFFPSIVTVPQSVYMGSYKWTSDPGDYRSRFRLYNEHQDDRTYYVRWDYLSSSGLPQIWIITDDKGDIRHCWEAKDPSDEEKPDISPITLSDMNTNKEYFPPGWKQIHIKLPPDFEDIKLLAKRQRKSISQIIRERKKVNVNHSKIKEKIKILESVDVLEEIGKPL